MQEQWGEAAKKMAELVDDDSFRSLEGKSKHQLWLELCDIITKHPKEVSGLKVDAILRSGIRKFTDEVWFSALILPRPASSIPKVWSAMLSSQLMLVLTAGGETVDLFGRLLHQAGPVRKRQGCIRGGPYNCDHCEF